MFSESPRKPSELDAALARLEKNVQERERNSRSFETPRGFAATIRFYNGNFTNLSLSYRGQTSLFEVTENGPTCTELRGVDGELLANESEITKQHTTEAQILFAEGKLSKDQIDPDGQYELDI